MYESATNYQYCFDIDKAYIKHVFNKNYKPLLIKKNIDPETVKDAESIFIETFNNESFDADFLKPKELILFSSLINIPIKIFYDKYYRFVYSNYSKKLLDWRLSNNFSQKEAAKLMEVSPVSLGYWENKLTFPSRQQYNLISNKIKKDTTFKSKLINIEI